MYRYIVQLKVLCYIVVRCELLVYVFWQKVLQYLNNFTKQCARFVSDSWASCFTYCTQTECSYTPCPKMYTPWLLTVSCCDLFATLLMHPLIQLDYPYAVINDHPHCRHCHTQPPNQNPGCFCQLSSPQQNSLKVRLVPPPCPFPYSSRFLIHVCSCMCSCQLK